MSARVSGRPVSLQAAGLQEGDYIVSVNGQPCKWWKHAEVVAQLKGVGEEGVTLQVVTLLPSAELPSTVSLGALGGWPPALLSHPALGLWASNTWWPFPALEEAPAHRCVPTPLGAPGRGAATGPLSHCGAALT